MSVLSLIWQLSAAGLVMALPVLLLRPAVRRRLPYVAMPILWLLVLAVFLIPMDIPSPLNIRRLWNAVSPQKLLTAFHESSRDYERYGHARHNPAMSFGELALTTAWVTGLIALVRKWVSLRLELTRRFKTATLLEGARYGRHFIGLRRQVRVYASYNTKSAVTYGVLRPKVILPYSLLAADDRTVGHVILHEVQHIRRFDSLQNMVWLGLVTVHWFNPIAWLCRIFVRRDMEYLCDAGVLRESGPGSRTDYARTILRLTPVKSSPALAASFGTANLFTAKFFGSGNLFGGGNLFPKARIRGVLSYRRPTARSFCVLALLVVALLALFSPGTSASYSSSRTAAVTAPSESLPTPDYTDSTGRYILLHVTDRVTNGRLYRSYTLLGSYDARDGILQKAGPESGANASEWRFACDIGSRSAFFSFRCVSLLCEGREYLLLDSASFDPNQSGLSLKSALLVIFSTKWDS